MSKGRLIVSDHRFYVDFLRAYISTGCTRFVVRHDLEKLISKVSSKQFYINRTEKSKARSQVKEIELALLKGATIWCFPDGTFTHLNKSGHWKFGIIKAAVRAGAAIEVRKMGFFGSKHKVTVDSEEAQYVVKHHGYKELVNNLQGACHGG